MADLPDRLAHDLRGPLAPLQTAVYLLRTGQVDDARRDELHDLLERQVGRLGGMIDELEDWLRIGQDRLLRSTTRFEPVQVLEVAVTGAGCAGGDPPDIDDASLLAQVVGDQRRLAQALRTLLEHARQQAGGAIPRVTVRSDDSHIVIDVVSTGDKPGAVETLLAQPLPDPGEDSLGLRLLIARAIAQAHGGTLEADTNDDAGGGLRLRCTLPLASPAR